MIPVDKSPLQNHGNADDSRTTLTHEDFGDPKPVPQDAREKQFCDTCWIWKRITLLALLTTIGVILQELFRHGK